MRHPLAATARWWGRQPPLVRGAVMMALLAFAALYPPTLSTYWQSVLFFPVGLYVLLALGLNIVVGQAGLLDLGYVAFYAVGAYTAAKLTTTFHWNPWAAIPFSIVLAMTAGVLLGAPTLRLRGDYLAIVTLGFGEIVRIVAQNTGPLGQSRGIADIPHPSAVAGVHFSQTPLPYYYVTLVAVVLALVLAIRLNRSRVGRAWVSVREDEDAAEAMGVPTFKMKLWAFAIGASTAGLGGWIYASKVGFIAPDNFMLFLSIYILSAVVLGGMGSLPGVLAGGFAIAFLPEYLRTAAAGHTLTHWLNKILGGHASDITEYRVLLFGAALVAMTIFRPQGLLPSRRRAAELAEAGEGRGLGASIGAGGEADVDEVLDGVVLDGEASSGIGPDRDGLAGEGDGGHRDGEGDRRETDGESDRRHRDGEGDGRDRERPGTATSAGAGAGRSLAPTGRSPGGPVLVIDNLRREFGGVVALADVSLELRANEIFGLIGPNGAGKTTVFNCVTGFFRPTSGTISLGGRRLAGRRPHQITAAGVARTFQNIRLFPNMTAYENVVVGTDAHHRTSVPGALLGVPRHRREERDGREDAVRLLDFVGIADRGGELARNLPYGDQRRLEIARAMATRPRVLLLDEPAAGMNPSEKRALMQLLRRIRDTGLTMLLIEHDMGLVMQVCDRVAVLDFGQKIAEGPPEAIQADPRVIEAYLGVPAEAS